MIQENTFISLLIRVLFFMIFIKMKLLFERKISCFQIHIKNVITRRLISNQQV